jgi:hypothetical protein
VIPDEVVERNSLRVPVHRVPESGEQQPDGEAAKEGSAAPARGNRLSFHEKSVHIIPGQQAGVVAGAGGHGDGGPSPVGAPLLALGGSVASVAGGEEEAGKEKRKSLLQSLQSMMGGGSFRTDFTLGQRSLSNTINMRCAACFFVVFGGPGLIRIDPICSESIVPLSFLSPSTYIITTGVFS